MLPLRIFLRSNWQNYNAGYSSRNNFASRDDQNWRYRNNFSQQHRSFSDYKPPSYSKNSEFKQSNERNGSGNFSPQNTKKYQNGNVVKTDTFNRCK